jgi:hypothetical protein
MKGWLFFCFGNISYSKNKEEGKILILGSDGQAFLLAILLSL